MNDIEMLKAKVRELLDTEHTGHGYAHVFRVYEFAKIIVDSEPTADKGVVLACALLHDIAYSEQPMKGEHCKEGARIAAKILDETGFSDSQKQKIVDAISVHSPFKYPASTEYTIETNILRDADRLDAVGYVGVMRAIAFATSAKMDFVRVLEEQLDYEFVTAKGKELAEPKREIIREFVDNLKSELNKI